MQTTKSDSYSPDYRRRYQTTANSCECPANMNGKYTCKHIRLERFIQSTNSRAAQVIINRRKAGENTPAISIRMNVFVQLRNEIQVSIADFLTSPKERKEANMRISWLKSQINLLERRVKMQQEKSNPPKQCEHKRTEERGLRQKEIHCLDCYRIIDKYWPRSL